MNTLSPDTPTDSPPLPITAVICVAIARDPCSAEGGLCNMCNAKTNTNNVVPVEGEFMQVANIFVDDLISLVQWSNVS